MPNYAALTDERDGCLAEARKIDELASKEKRKFSGEEQAKWDKCFARVDEIDDECNRAKALDDAEARARASSAGQPGVKTTHLGGDPDTKKKGEARSFKIRDREIRCEPGTPLYERNFGEYRTAFRSYLETGDIAAMRKPEFRALQTDIDTKGGFITTPEEFIAELIKDLDDEVFMRGLARRFVTRAQSIGAPRRTAKASTWVWGSELQTPTEDTAYAFGKRAVSPHHMMGEISVSNDLLGSAVMNVEQIVIDELNLDRVELEEAAFMTGHGSNQPLGIFTASADGISTGRDVSTGSTTAITADGLIDAFYSLKQAYQNNATGLFSRTAIKNIRKLKDGDGQYLWQPGLQAGQPAVILGRPYIQSEWVPATFTTGLYVGMFADFQWYWIVDGLEIGLKRDSDSVTAARGNKTHFVARFKVDGAPVKEEAFARIKLA